MCDSAENSDQEKQTGQSDGPTQQKQHPQGAFFPFLRLWVRRRVKRGAAGLLGVIDSVNGFCRDRGAARLKRMGIPRDVCVLDSRDPGGTFDTLARLNRNDRSRGRYTSIQQRPSGPPDPEEEDAHAPAEDEENQAGYRFWRHTSSIRARVDQPPISAVMCGATRPGEREFRTRPVRLMLAESDQAAWARNK